MAKVKAIKLFSDIEETLVRQDGDVWECSNERADYLNSKNLVIILETDKLADVRNEESASESVKTKKKQIKPSHLEE